MKSVFLFVFLLLCCSCLVAQSVISGKVIDSDTKEGLAFATILVPNTLLGTVTNIDGEFELKLSEAAEEIQASYIGYSDQVLKITDLNKTVLFELSTQTFSLDEIIVRSKTPLQFIIEAVENHPENFSQVPFETRGYFSEKASMVNDKTNAYKLSESVFKSYLSVSIDTTEKDQNQLALFRTSEKGEFDTMLDEGKKIQKKIRKGKIDLDEEGNPEDIDIDIEGFTGGGPTDALEIVRSLLSLPFLEAKHFKKFKYTFGTPTTYQGKDLIAINFISKRKIDNSKYDGSLYLDYNNLAIVAVHYKENIKIPFYINMLIHGIIGFKIDEINQRINIQNQRLDSTWYPKKIQKNGLISFLQEGQTERLNIQQLFSIDQIEAEAPAQIELSKRFDTDKEKEEQIFPIDGLTWDKVNVVKTN